MPKMAEDSVRSAIDAISRRLQEELESHLVTLESRHQEELEAVRRASESDAEQRWTARVESVRAEWTARLESEIAAARAESERRMVAESMRLRVEAEQTAAEAAARLREELESAFQGERQRTTAELAGEREQLTAERDRLRRELDEARDQIARLNRDAEEISAARALAESELEATRQQHQDEIQRQARAVADDADARLAERQVQLAVVERILSAIGALDGARSLTQVLSTLLASAAAEAPRVALFVMHGRELKAWKAAGFDEDPSSLHIDLEEGGLLADVLRGREPVVTSEGEGPHAPAFARLPHGRAAIGVPLLVGEQPVAVLYADDAGDGESQAPASWPEAVQILSRHASVNLAHLTAARAADAMRRSLAPAAARPATAGSAPPAVEDGASARRYARLLVSEIKLYNESAVRLGREKRDLLERLKPEIDRARRLYEQRIPPAVDSRAALFQQELIQTLADGDPALLGAPR
jgi:hypothetical protein